MRSKGGRSATLKGGRFYRLHRLGCKNIKTINDILHSDRGCRFTSEEYQCFLAAHHITCSMSAVGSCADNAAAESFFGVLKRERVNRRQYRTRAEARADIFDYIEPWHNPRQRRRLAFQQEAEKLLTHVSVETG